jgi:hypothetical protein
MREVVIALALRTPGSRAKKGAFRQTRPDDLGSAVIRAILAKRHGATIGCPLTTGIFAWIASHAAEELAAQGRKRITPYWRTLKSTGDVPGPVMPCRVQTGASPESSMADADVLTETI